jgi:hypothetical protein
MTALSLVTIDDDEPVIPWRRKSSEPLNAQEPFNPRPRFALIPFDKIVVGSEPAYLVKGLIPRDGIVVLYGPPKSGKSFFVLDLVMHVALGWPYRERRVMRGPVVYCALEGVTGFKARVEAFRTGRLPEVMTDVPFHLMSGRLVLAKDQEELVGSIRQSLGDGRPAIVVIDTLNRSIGGSENDDRDMAAYIGAATTIQRAFQCAVIIIHHTGVNTSRPRGHTSLTGAADAQIAVNRDSANNVVATVEWMKDGPEGDRIISKLVAVEVGQDEDGDPITSCVIEAIDGGGQGASAGAEVKKGPKLPDSQALGLRILHDCIIEGGEELPATFDIPGRVRGVKVEVWRTELHRRGVIAPDAKNKRDAYSRIRNGLAAKALIGERDGLIWAVHSSPP